MSEKIKFPELELLLENSAVIVSSTPVITFSGLSDTQVLFWKKNYPKGSGKAKAAMLAAMMDYYFKGNGVFVAPTGAVHPVVTTKL